MNWPPCIMRLRIRNQKRRVSLWLPMFLILIIIVAFAIALFPIVLVASAVLWRSGKGKPLLLAGPAILKVLFALRGLEVYVEQRSEQVFISII